ncbi:MAG: hypothetical protein VYE73_13190 [Acidobacteriota bacterium]|nr:hypothetical protein [Acidobacteriota bacterium]
MTTSGGAGAPDGALVARIREGVKGPLYLVTGEILLAEAAGLRIADALAEATVAEIESYRHPESLAPRLGDLRTYSLFSSAKIVVVIASGVLADRRGAAHLIDQAAEALPVSPDDKLSDKGRVAAGRLLQVCRLFGLEPYGESPENVVSELPEWVFAGGAPPGGRARAKKRAKAAAQDLRSQLADLLEAANAAGLEGWAEGDAADLAAVATDGLPDGHHLVMCEVAVAEDHPLVQALRADETLLELGRVEADRRGRWQGLDALAAELERETGRSIVRPALEELGRRTLRHGSGRGQSDGIDADSTSRFAAEYRKLASLAESGRIEQDLVRDVVEDRGEEDVWKLLDAIGEGRGGEALTRLDRLVDGAEDSMAARLSFFGRLASFCGDLAAVAGTMEAVGVPSGERNFNRFKSQYASRLMEPLPETGISAVGKVHPFRLHKAYLAACRFPGGSLAGLPAKVLDTELRLKGESGDPQAALAGLVAWLASAGRG